MDRKVILFPIDFSDRALKALRESILLAKKLDSRLVLYHVYHRPILDGSSATEFESLLRKTKQRIEQKFEQLLKDIPELASIPHEFKTELGILVDSVVSYTEKEKVELIVLATKGARGLGMIWGTKSANIIKRVEVPVLVIPENSTLHQINKIALACDYSMNADYESLGFLGSLAEKLKLDIDVVTLNRDEASLSKAEQRNKEGVLHLLDTVPSTFSFTSGINVQEGLFAYCTHHKIGLIAVLPKNYNFLETLFHDSLIEKMAFHSSIPFLVLNARTSEKS